MDEVNLKTKGGPSFHNGKTTIHPDEELKDGEMFQPMNDDEMSKKTGGKGKGKIPSKGGKQAKKSAADDSVAIFDIGSNNP